MKLALVTILLAISMPAFAQNAPAGTSQQRWDTFNSCRQKENAPGLKLGAGFIANLVSGDLPAAYVDWAKMIIQKSPDLDCLALLNPDERAEQQQRDAYLRQYRKVGPLGGSGPQ